MPEDAGWGGEIMSIVLGNCIDYMKNLDDKVFDIAFTSPPYNRKRNDTYKMFNDNNTDYLYMLNYVTSELLRLVKGNVIINLQMNMYNKADISRWQAQFADKLKGIVVWIKNNPVPTFNKRADGFSVTNGYENFYVLGDDTTSFKANTPIVNWIKTNVNEEHYEGHGAIMKYEVADFFIRNFSKEGDFVFDPFMGIGTTACACISNKRRWGG